MENKLPAPCSECAPFDGNWRITDKGLIRCLCPRGQALKVAAIRPKPSGPPQPRISEDAAAQAVRALSDIPFFPSAEEARTMIADDLMSLCHNTEELRWIVHRMRSLFDRWPGSRTLRIVFCQKHHPLDGHDLGSAISEAFPEGIPLESPLPQPALLALPEGAKVSADPMLEAAIHDLAIEINKPPEQRTRPVGMPIVPASKRITPADIQEAVEQLHKAKGQ